MSRNYDIKAASLRISVGILAAVLLYALASCENSLMEAVMEVQAETASPILSINSEDGTLVESGGIFNFSGTSVGGTKPLDIIITNSGKTTLAITLPSILLTMMSGTEEGGFTIEQLPAEFIEPGKITKMTLVFNPTTAGVKTATLTIPTNDVGTPTFVFSLSGTGLSTGKDFTTFSIANPVVIGNISAETIEIIVPENTQVSNLVSVFTTSPGTTVSIAGVAQTSNITANDFSNPLEYTVTAADGNSKTYIVTIILLNVAPVLDPTTAPSMSSITTVSATGAGTIKSNGGATIIVSGLCWSTSQNPTILSSNSTDGSVSGSFFSTIGSLIPGTTYYVRSYATNNVGTGYGDQVQFTTLPAEPSAPTVASIPGPAGSGQLAVSWPAVTGATLYEVYCNTSNSIPANSTSGGTDIAGTSCTLVGLTNYSTYYVWVKAKGVSGLGGASIASVPIMVGIKVASISLSKTSATFLPGSSETITVTYTPTTATQPSVNWGTSASNCATASDGVITGGSTAGSATITATAIDGGGATKTFAATTKLFAANTAGPAGGVLFYDSLSYGTKGWRYMETAPTNVGSGLTWYLTYMIIPGATQWDFGTGKSNTTAIVTAVGPGAYFALECKNYSLNGYTDWFMPSMNEADKLLNVVTGSIVNIHCFYSSTQNSGASHVQGYSNSSGTVAFRWTAVYADYTGGASYHITRPVRQF